MKLRIPPALQVLFSVFLMWIIKRLTQQTHFNFEYQKELSWFIFYSGVIIGLMAVYSFKKAKTTVDPVNPNKATNLVVSGLYKHSRNPMYLAMLLVLMAYFTRLGNWYSLVILVLYVWYITKFQIKPEEKILSEKFGDAYVLYKTRVRRWI